MNLVRVPVSAGTLISVVGALVRETREAIGWSQAELGERTGTSQTKVWRVERMRPGALDLATLDSLLSALGLRMTLEVGGWHLRDRAEQRDVVHAALVQAFARRLRRSGWIVHTEVPIGREAPTGWIDLLAFREQDAALLIGEIKSRIDDIGGLQRQVDRYDREAVWAARRLGWQPEVARLAVVCLDSVEVAEAARFNRGILAPAFPGEPGALDAWLRGTGGPPPAGRTLAMIDLAPRRGPALLQTPLAGRRRAAPAYTGYAEAAEVLRGPRRRPAGPPRSRPPSGRSPTR